MTVLGWWQWHRSQIAGRAAALGYLTMASFDALPFGAWYGLLELWFVEVMAGEGLPQVKVMEWLREDVPAEWARLHATPDTHGRTPRAQAAQATAEARYGATPAP